MLAGRKRPRSKEQAQHTKDQLAAANHFLNRSVEAAKQGHADEQKTWLDAFGAINAGIGLSTGSYSQILM